MTDSIEQDSSTDHLTSTVEEEALTTTVDTTPNRTLAALATGAALLAADQIDQVQDDNPERLRRRSSMSIVQALVNSSHLLTTNDARKRNFLVGAARQLPQNKDNDISSHFSNGRSLTITVATWNTGEASKLYEQNYTPTAREKAEPKEEMLNDMSDILLPTSIDYVSDMIVICTQEMSVSKKRIDWEILLQEVVGPTHVLFHSIHFGTLSLCIFIRRDLIWFCTEPEEDIIKYRAVGPVRTKASLAITFNLFGTSFMIINSHFEAGHGTESRANRRLNFHNTTTKLAIPHEFFQRTVPSNKRITALVMSNNHQRLEGSSSLDSVTQPVVDMTKSCDCVLWAGDMNFRIDLSQQDVLEHCKDRNYAGLLLKDEFHTAKEKKDELYCEFKEAPITFPPTYKFDLRSNGDTYVKHRVPSYTDRIIYRDKPTSPIECTQYKSVESVNHSDHKPVIAHFCVKLKPGLNTGHLSYGKFNHDVYKRGCKQREHHHSLGVGLRHTVKRRAAMPKSSVCVLQ